MRRISVPSRAAVADALGWLAQPGCPVCRQADAAAERFFAWFAIETANDPPTIAKMREGAGMCPAHTRRALHQDGAQHRLTSLYQQILPSARDRVATSGLVGGDCPACQAREEASTAAWETLRAALADQAVRAAYSRADGLCVPHLLRAFDARPAWPALLAHTAARTLTRAGPRLLPMLAGTDDEAALRARWRTLLPAAGMPGEADDEPVTTVARLRVRLAVDACPLCLTQGQAERRYLAWLAGEYRRDPDGLANEPGGFCPAHLHDLAVADPGAAGWALHREQHRWAARFTRARTLLHPTAASGASSDGVDALLGDHRAPWDAVREAISRDTCLVCRAVRDAVDGETALLLAGLCTRSVARAYEDSAGLCLRHLASTPAEPDVAGLLRRVALARAGLLVVELVEAGRKSGWLARHEAGGPEATAWVRAPALIDGQVFLGGPPRTPEVNEPRCS